MGILNLVTHKALGLLFALGTFIGTTGLLYLASNERAAKIGAIFLLFPPPLYLEQEFISMGGHAPNFGFFVVIILWLLWEIFRKPPASPLLVGVTAAWLGLSLTISWGTLMFIPVLCFMIWRYGRPFSRKVIPIAVFGLFIGSLWWLIFHLETHFIGIDSLFTGFVGNEPLLTRANGAVRNSIIWWGVDYPFSLGYHEILGNLGHLMNWGVYALLFFPLAWHVINRARFRPMNASQNSTKKLKKARINERGSHHLIDLLTSFGVIFFVSFSIMNYSGHRDAYVFVLYPVLTALTALSLERITRKKYGTRLCLLIIILSVIVIAGVATIFSRFPREINLTRNLGMTIEVYDLLPRYIGSHYAHNPQQGSLACRRLGSQRGEAFESSCLFGLGYASAKHVLENGGELDCEHLSSPYLINSCWEALGSYTAETSSRNLATAASRCPALPPRAREHCYLVIGGFVGGYGTFNPRIALQGCRAFPAEGQDTCFYGIGNARAGMDLMRPWKAHQACLLLEEGAEQCLKALPKE